MRRKFGLTLAILAAIGLESPSMAQDKQDKPAVYAKVLDCRSIKENEARLDCFDASVAAMAEAEASNDLLLADKEQVEETKRGLFGLTLPKIKLLGGGDDENTEIKEIESKVTAVSRGRRGYVFTLEDGAVWTQTDDNYLRPDVGDTLRIKKAAFTSYKARLNGGPSFRIKRVR